MIFAVLELRILHLVNFKQANLVLIKVYRNTINYINVENDFTSSLSNLAAECCDAGAVRCVMAFMLPLQQLDNKY